MQTVNLRQKFSLFSDHWKQRIVGELNDSQIKVVKIKGNSSGTIMTVRTNSSWLPTALCG